MRTSTFSPTLPTNLKKKDNEKFAAKRKTKNRNATAQK
jgi:hypothetical protein